MQVCLLTTTVSELFIPKRSTATKVKASIDGPYSSPYTD